MEASLSGITSVGSLLDNLRLIDTARDCVVRAEDMNAPEYFALSYVWGKGEMKRETGVVPVVLERKMIA